MADQITDTEIPVADEIKEVELDVLEKEENAVIVKVDGWRMRVYFADGFDGIITNKVVAQYTGDIEDAHTVAFERLK